MAKRWKTIYPAYLDNCKSIDEGWHKLFYVKLSLYLAKYKSLKYNLKIWLRAESGQMRVDIFPLFERDIRSHSQSVPASAGGSEGSLSKGLAQ